MTRARLAALLLGLALLLEGAPAAARELRFGTILPTGSAWMKEFQQLSRRVAQRTQRHLILRFIGDAILGDERDLVRKLDAGALQGAAMTSVGTGMLLPSVRILELPLLFESTAEIDAIRDALAPAFTGELRRRGYELLGWGDLGWVHLFTTVRLRSLADLRRLKVWSWTDDPIARSLVRRLGVKGVPLGIQDVLPSLQTELIDACYGSPFITLALQWHTKIRFFTREHLTYAVGALVVSQPAWQSLTPRQREILGEESRLMSTRLMQRSRVDNARAATRLKELGAVEYALPADILARFRVETRGLWQEMAGRLYSRALLDRVMGILRSMRGSSR